MSNAPAHKDDPLRGKKTGKWTKYGGAIYGLVKEEIQDTWFCQICSDEVPKELPPFNYELYPDEFIRICNVCKQKTDLVKQMERSNVIVCHRVIKIRRTKRD